jgi:hypothetical protein
MRFVRANSWEIAAVLSYQLTRTSFFLTMVCSIVLTIREPVHLAVEVLIVATTESIACRPHFPVENVSDLINIELCLSILITPESKHRLAQRNKHLRSMQMEHRMNSWREASKACHRITFSSWSGRDTRRLLRRQWCGFLPTRCVHTYMPFVQTNARKYIHFTEQVLACF